MRAPIVAPFFVTLSECSVAWAVWETLPPRIIGAQSVKNSQRWRLDAPG